MQTERKKASDQDKNGRYKYVNALGESEDFRIQVKKSKQILLNARRNAGQKSTSR